MHAALPPDFNDHDGGVVWRAAAGLRHRHGIGTAATAGNHHRRRTDRESDAHALHHAGDLFISGLLAAESEEQTSPGNAAGGIEWISENAVAMEGSDERNDAHSRKLEKFPLRANDRQRRSGAVLRARGLHRRAEVSSTGDAGTGGIQGIAG